MFGTIHIVRPRAERFAAVVAHFETWGQVRANAGHGFVSGQLYRGVDDSGQLMAAVVFESRMAYEQNAEDPAQVAWYQQLVQMLDESTMTEGIVLQCWSSAWQQNEVLGL